MNLPGSVAASRLNAVTHTRGHGAKATFILNLVDNGAATDSWFHDSSPAMSQPRTFPTTATQTDLLAGLTAEQRDHLLGQMRRLQLRKGEHLMRQGEAAEHMYYVLRGRFEVLREGRHLVAEIGAGELLGEIAFFGGLSRTADVVASRDSEVLELSRTNFNLLAASHPDFTQSILRTLGRRLAVTTAAAVAMAPRIADAIGLCPAGSVPLPATLVQQLCTALLANGSSSSVLRAGDLPAGLEADNEQLLSQWLGTHESRGNKLLLVTGEGNHAWDRAALRHCDQLLLCGRLDEAASGPVGLAALEAYVMPLFRPRQINLLLWREQPQQPIIGTRHWLQLRPAHLHHHVALGQALDFGRVARLLTGRALGAVFGGGGALGASHVGVLRALAEAGVGLDIVGGTSIGAVAALAYANGDDPRKVMDDYDDFFIRRKAVSHFNLPWYSLLDHRHLDACLRERYGDTCMEDLPLSAFAVGANLSTHELEVLRHGSCWQAMRISTAVPVALPPWINARGQVLVDGGIMNNVPISVMRAIKSGPNLVCMLSPGDEWRVKTDYNNVPTRLKLAWQLLAGGRKGDDYPRIGAVAAHAMQVTSGRTFRGSGMREDLLLEPPAVPGMGMVSFKLGRTQEAASYDYMRRFLERIGGSDGLAAWRRGEGLPAVAD